MGKLIVLSEINCISFLEIYGIYPDEFYTDFMLFKNKAASFIGVDILIIFAGCCNFSKRRVLEVTNLLQRRAETSKDTGINSLTVISDVYLPSVKKYYKFRGKLSNISEYSGWKLKERNSNIWKKVPKGNKSKSSEVYLTDYDNGNVTELKEMYLSTISNDDDLRSLIRKPDFSNIQEM